MSTSTISNVFFLFQTQPKKKISTATVRRFPPHPSNLRVLSLGLRCTAAGMSSVAARGSSRVQGSGGGCFEQPSKRIEGSGGKRPAVAPPPGGSSIIEGIAFIALVVFENFVKIVASGIYYLPLVVCLVYQAFAYGIGSMLLVVWLGYQTSMTWLSKFVDRKGNWPQSNHLEDYKGVIIWTNGYNAKNLGEIWIWEHNVGCKGLDLEQINVLRSTGHSVLEQHPSTFDVKSHIELAPSKYDQAERMVRFTCKILTDDIKAFHKVTDELWIGIKQLVDCKT